MRLMSLAILLSLHPIHVSMTSIEYFSDSNEIKVFVRMYYDDFLLDYQLCDIETDTGFFLNESGFPPEKLGEYIDEKIGITIDGEKLIGDLINMSVQDNELEANFVYAKKRGGEALTIYNALLSDLYDDQSNMTIVKINDTEEGIMFTNTYRERMFFLND